MITQLTRSQMERCERAVAGKCSQKALQRADWRRRLLIPPPVARPAILLSFEVQKIDTRNAECAKAAVRRGEQRREARQERNIAEAAALEEMQRLKRPADVPQQCRKRRRTPASAEECGCGVRTQVLEGSPGGDEGASDQPRAGEGALQAELPEGPERGRRRRLECSLNVGSVGKGRRRAVTLLVAADGEQLERQRSASLESRGDTVEHSCAMAEGGERGVIAIVVALICTGVDEECPKPRVADENLQSLCLNFEHGAALGHYHQLTAWLPGSASNIATACAAPASARRQRRVRRSRCGHEATSCIACSAERAGPFSQ